MLAALRAMPRRQRECLVLRYWGELSEAEIADALVIARARWRATSHRGMAALAIALEDHR